MISDAEYLKQRQQEIDIEEKKATTGDVQQDYQASVLREQQTNLVREQLGLGEELDTIENLLRGNVLKKDQHGIRDWCVPEHPEMIVLTEHGVHLIMNTILFYLNKNTLLSNYDEETINKKMEDFSIDLSDVIFMEYEKVFKYPSFEECKKVLQERLDRKRELRKFALELAGKETNDEELSKQILEEIEYRIEYELEKIKEQLIKNKLKRFSIIVRSVQDTVHSTYLRALFGAERRTLRQHIHISETTGGNNNPPIKQTQQRFNTLNWGRK